MKTVSIIGKPNVGKSTIFNRLIGEKKAIIMDEPGITRDRLYGEVNFDNYHFFLVDTGGIDSELGNFNSSVKDQAELAIIESDVILFVVDGKEELTKSDYEVRDMLLKCNKKVIVVVNKLDNNKLSDNIYNYYELGFPLVMGVSASHNIGFGDLLDEVVKDFTESTAIEDNRLKFCIIGRPNVGKSSLTNAILNEDRVIVSDIAGTTRDAIDTVFKYNNEEYVVIDTAGMRKKGKINEHVERFSFLRSMKAIERSDVCVIVINASEGIIEHDKHIMSYAVESGKAIVLAVNKWDLIDNQNTAIREWKKKVANEFQFVPYAKLVFLSALTKKRVHTLMPEIIAAYENNHKELKTSLLNDCIINAVSMHEAPSYKGKRLKIYYTHQTGTNPPKITFDVNNKGLVHFSYERYLENEIRKSFDLTGTPIVLQFKNKER